MHDQNEGVAGNERLTAWAGLVLLVLLLVELVTAIRLRSLIQAHVFVGVLLVGPLIVKLGTTGYRFVRYYTGSAPYIRRGAPRLTLRILAVPFVPTTLVVVGSGGGLLLAGPTASGSLVAVHNISTLLWLPMFTIHAFAYVRRLPGLVARDVRPATKAPRIGSRLRLAVTACAVVAAAIAAAILLPSGVPWINWAQTNEQIPAPLIVGTILSIAAVVLARRLVTWSDGTALTPSDIAQH